MDKQNNFIKKLSKCSAPLAFVAILAFGIYYLKYYKTYVEHPIVVVIPSYNNINWYTKNLSMLLSQNKTYKNWRAIYIDDCSTDGTAQAVEQYITENNLQNKITLIKNTQRSGSLANAYKAIHSCKDNEIVVICDGDDWLKDETVLQHINQTYQNKNVWLTYGQYEIYPSGTIGHCRKIPDVITQHKKFRKYSWCSSHLRTFYAGLFKKIKKEDLLYDGKFFPVTTDMAAMFPMLEMAGKRATFIPKVLYVYNQDNPINNYKQRLNLQLYFDQYIRGKERYTTVNTINA